MAYVIWRDPPIEESGTVCCRCCQRMTVLESLCAPNVGSGLYICPRCEYPPPRLVKP